MKPRLKLSITGRLTLLREGLSGLNEDQTKRSLQKSHGSLLAFSRKHGVNYAGLCSSFNVQSERFAGNVATARQLLGLPSNPTKGNLSLAVHHAKRRAAAKPGART